MDAEAVFRLRVDDNTSDNDIVVTLDVYDVTADVIVVDRAVARTEFVAPATWQDLEILADLTGRAGHVMESRVYWHDVATVALDRVVVTTR